MENQHSTGPAPIQPSGEAAEDGLALPGLEYAAPGDARADRSSNRRALWISLAALAAVATIAVPVIVHLTRATPGHLQTPAQIGALTRDKSAKAADTADYLRSAIAAGMGLDPSVGAVYSDGGGDAHSVIFIGGSSTDGSSSARLSRAFGLLDDATDGITAIVTEPSGALGGDMRCGLATGTGSGSTNSSSSDTEMAVCGWADYDTVGIAMFPNRSVADAAILMRAMRPAIELKK